VVQKLESHIKGIRLQESEDLQSLMDAIGEAKIVLLGEASHGTAEYYDWRTEISRKLVETKGFSFIAVEGDWPSCYEVNRYIKGRSKHHSAEAMLQESFQRWPTWMWANRETERLVTELKQINETREAADHIGFYGIDMYSLWESMEETLRYLKESERPEWEIAQKAFSCFEPYARDPQTYGVQASFFSEDCEEEVVQLLNALQTERAERGQDVHESEEKLSAELNAMVATNAEQYYRAMVRGGPQSWNIRDRHMVAALERILEFHGTNAKAIVWEHNTHIGDARYTDMVDDGMVNVGQLMRESHSPQEVYAVGFGSYEGEVIAARAWGDPWEVMPVPPAEEGSWEHQLHQVSATDRYLLFDDTNRVVYDPVIGHRAIGVVYHPEREWGNYVPTSVSRRYDAFIYLDKTKAVQPLHQAGILQKV
jgi:erythromycin esterase-like protein